MMTLTRACSQLQATIAARDAFIKDLEDQARSDAQERRKLHNMVQELKGAILRDSKRTHLKLYTIPLLLHLRHSGVTAFCPGNIRVFARVRPSEAAESVPPPPLPLFNMKTVFWL
jgi:hypothetical protein